MNKINNKCRYFYSTTTESEPLLPDTIKFIKENLEKYGSVHFELPHVFVVFGASVSNFLISIFKCFFNF